MSLTLGGAIRRLRHASGLSLRGLAQRVGVGYTYLSHIEADRREPTIRVLRQIGTALQIPPGPLISIVLLVDLPEEDRPLYETLIEQFIQIAEIRVGGEQPSEWRNDV